jgi:predicted DNA-binding transcriptional regulator AlpA
MYTSGVRNPYLGGSTIRAVTELLGLTDIARLLGRSKPVVVGYAQRPDFPRPLGKTASGRVWRRSDIERWRSRHFPPKIGRPAKDRKRR